ncbi:MAG: hypothetical protein U9N43_04795 [Euryarchaeota archaeon]|nr:hypothetical protein [Euryarchaeota archaeon]
MIHGTIEPLVGWETQKDGRQALDQRATIAFMPGCSARTDTAEFTMGEFGVWAVK